MTRDPSTTNSQWSVLPVHDGVASRLLRESVAEPDNEVLLRKTIALDPALTLAVFAQQSHVPGQAHEQAPTYRGLVDRLSVPVCRFAAVRAVAHAAGTKKRSGAQRARWKRAYVRAAVARALAAASQRVDPEVSGIAALLYDAGGFVDPESWKTQTIDLLEQHSVPEDVIATIRDAHAGAFESASLDARVLIAADSWSRFTDSVYFEPMDVGEITPDLTEDRLRRILSDALEDAARVLESPGEAWETIRDRAIEILSDLALGAFDQIDELRASMRELSKQVATDALTGVYSRLAFTQRYAEEMERARRDGLPITLFLLDIDNFKSINDTHGHPAGDAYLTALAGVLQSVARRIDVVARYGGEEFAIILPHTNLAGASAIAERLRQSVESLVVEHGGEEIRSTASIGSCTLLNAERGRTTPEQLIQHADRQLYVAKRAGKNRAELMQLDDPYAAAG